jgi:predicted solute-binding protein
MLHSKHNRQSTALHSKHHFWNLLRYHYETEEMTEFKNFEMEYVAKKANISDIFTRPLDSRLLKSIEIP